ncbi:MAG: tetratricopeptide repeat protein [Bacteroidales bacterium]|jgi:tetratricopeptide (TPR) repeat protein|nr:tetratricopeptide repeat protein [Bacteroidales bacterium]MCI2121384.1 tetratricopeptide repeat protein [Bacteroidales bacterium]MCI2145497.1 tetratricopeptide repeat protein [Bacteroidales bacterium]
MKLKTAITTVIVCCLSVLPVKAQYDRDMFLSRGRQALINGKYALAIENFNILARLDSTEYNAYFFRGIAKYNLGDFNGARMDFDRSLHFNPIFTPAYHYRAITLSRLGKYEEALEDLQEAVDLRPGYNDLYFSRGVTYFLSQQFDKAIGDFDMYLRHEPESTDAYLDRGASYLFLGDTIRAMQDYDKAVSIDRFDADCYVRRSRIYALKGNDDAAISDLNTAINLDSSYTLAHFNRALLLYGNKDVKGALADLNKVLKDDPGNALTLYNRALILAQMGDYENSLNDFDRVIYINPNNVLAYFNRASVFLDMGRWADAAEDYTRAIELYPDFAKAYMNRSYANSMMGHKKESESDYKTAQKKVQAYMIRTRDSAGAALFADTNKQYNKLISFESDFSKKNFDNELLQYRDVDIKLKPLYRITPGSNDNNALLISENLNYPRLNRFLSSLPVKMVFSANKVNYSINTYGNLLGSGSLGEGRDSKTLFTRAIFEAERKQFNTSMVLYEQALRKDSSDAFIYINRGALQAEMIDFISSMGNNVPVISLSNSNSTHTRLQEQVSENYDYTAALMDMKRAADMIPDFPYVYYNLGNLYTLSNNLPEAIDQYTHALKLYPYIPEAYYNRGLVLIYLKDKEKGCIDISKAGELGISDAYAVIKKYCETENNQ